jgi:hypothetical protein
MITGNPSPHLRVVTYRDERELDRYIDDFLELIYSREFADNGAAL